MGLVHNILKRTITKKLPSPVAVVNPTMIVSKSDKEHHRTIMRIETKFRAKKPLTGKDKYDFKQAARILEKRGSLTWVKEVEIPDTM